MDQEVKPWRRLALVFPGQGSQYPGMGERLAKISRAAREIFRRADEILEQKISRLCFEGSAEELEETSVQQPALFVTSIAWLAALRERWEALDRKLEPYVIAGHSMGEYTAAVAAGTMSFEEGLLAVKERGRLMEEAGRERPGGMASILGLSTDRVIEICFQASEEEGDYVGVATNNCEGQNVISGALRPLRRAMELAEKAGARRVIKLPISIASHSPLMAKASEGMARVLEALHLRDPERPLVSNIDVSYLRSEGEVFTELRDQLIKGVLWQKAVETMRRDGVDMFIEVGPGNVLTRLIRRIDYEANAVSLSDEHEGLFSENFALVEAAAR